jgi:uncharacterized protein (TIGR00255 family)
MTINSMTAFARETDDTGPGGLAVEIRSVNHRYLDCQFKLPEHLRGLEPGLRERLQSRLSRGKLEIMLRWQVHGGGTEGITVNQARLEALLEALRQVESTATGTRPPTSLDILHWPGVVDTAADEDLNRRVAEMFDRALASLLEMRQREGEKLAGFIRERLTAVSAEVEKARTRMPELLAQQRQRLETRLAELDAELDTVRLEQELVIIAQKADVEEELDRLDAHVEEVLRVLDKGGPCGRRLDFLMQELNREANTLSSKSLATSTTQNAVELKVLIEQMREQIQNLE